ncbi:transglutaminase family protein [Rhodobacteraceae bacterium]|nr:transglutaminase family protein [Paracoccaceae bacterium]
MRYDLKLKITYRYDGPTDRARNLLRLRPLSLDGVQTVDAARLEITPPPSERHEFRDFFGNHVCHVAWNTPITDLSVALHAQVRRFATATMTPSGLAFSDMAEALRTAHSLSPEAPHHFTAASPRLPQTAEIATFARDFVEPGRPVETLVRRLGHAIHERMIFDPHATTVTTPAAVAFAERRGVCQDFAHIMIVALRSLGIPAGYVSGFLRTYPPPGQPRLEGADAMHAWVRIWTGAKTGWIEFDPTNDQAAGEDYITVGVGRDYSDVAPVRGTMRSAGGQETAQAVDVIPKDSTA